jgi:hypothetical protein
METFGQLMERCLSRCRADKMEHTEGIEFIMREIAKKLDDDAATRGLSVDCKAK